MRQQEKRKIEVIDDTLYLSCTKCREMKPDDYYTVNKISPTGLDYYCRDCKNKIKKNQREEQYTYTYKSQEKFINNMFDVMGYDINDDISKQFNNKIKKKYGVDLS